MAVATVHNSGGQHLCRGRGNVFFFFLVATKTKKNGRTKLMAPGCSFFCPFCLGLLFFSLAFWFVSCFFFLGFLRVSLFLGVFFVVSRVGFAHETLVSVVF